ncbi:MAG: GDP-mannose 4,6-dehydratase [Phycisphaerales bacterium]
MSQSNQTVLLTGAAGFIGSHVAEALLSRGDHVIGFDNFDPFYDESLKRRNLEEVRATSKRLAVPFDFIQADLNDPAALAGAFERFRPTGVIHLAAKAGVRPSLDDPMGYMRANVLGTTAVLEAAKAAIPAGCSRVVMASSSSVYGNNTIVPFSEAHDVSEPISPYAASKRACEIIAHTYWHLTRMPTACLRFFTVYGPRQRPDLAIRLFLKLAARGEPISMYGTGESSRDYTFIDDIVRGVLAAYDRIPEYGYRVWNLGGSRPTSLANMIDTIARVVGRSVKVDHRPARPGDVQQTFADTSRSAAELGYEPRVSFEEGVRRQWDWMKSVGDI